MINDNIKIHDKFQFELKLSYMLDFSKKYIKNVLFLKTRIQKSGKLTE